MPDWEMGRLWRMEMGLGIGRCLNATNRSDIDDPPPASLPHMWNRKLRQRGKAKEIDLDLPSCFLKGHFFDGAIIFRAKSSFPKLKGYLFSSV